MHCQVGLGRLQDDWQPHVRSDAGLSALLQRCTACPRYLPATPSEPGCFVLLCSLMLGCSACPSCLPATLSEPRCSGRLCTLVRGCTACPACLSAPIVLEKSGVRCSPMVLAAGHVHCCLQYWSTPCRCQVYWSCASDWAMLLAPHAIASPTTRCTAGAQGCCLPCAVA